MVFGEYIGRYSTYGGGGGGGGQFGSSGMTISKMEEDYFTILRTK